MDSIKQGTRYRRQLHLPDLFFSQHCETRYGINRGIYNTLELMLFEEGFHDILARRRAILAFLDFTIKDPAIYSRSRCKFGPGGLTAKWREFCIVPAWATSKGEIS